MSAEVEIWNSEWSNAWSGR